MFPSGVLERIEAGGLDVADAALAAALSAACPAKLRRSAQRVARPVTEISEGSRWFRLSFDALDGTPPS